MNKVDLSINLTSCNRFLAYALSDVCNSVSEVLSSDLTLFPLKPRGIFPLTSVRAEFRENQDLL